MFFLLRAVVDVPRPEAVLPADVVEIQAEALLVEGGDGVEGEDRPGLEEPDGFVVGGGDRELFLGALPEEIGVDSFGDRSSFFFCIKLIMCVHV